MSGGEIETEVILDADGRAVFQAFDEVAKRVRDIQASVTSIHTKAREAANAFGGSLQKTLGDFNKTIASLEKFQNNVTKINAELFAQSPHGQMAAQAQAMRQRSQDEDRAYALRDAQRAQAAEKIRRDEARGFLEIDRQQSASAIKLEETKSRLGEERWARQRAAEMQTEREVQRLREQNRIKQMRDMAQMQVADARGLGSLQGLKAASSANLADLRARRDLGSQQDQRQIEIAITLEKERLRLVEQRIAAEARANAKIVSSDDRINAALGIRSGRNEERALGAQLGLNQAKLRQADLEASIAAQIDRAYLLTGKEKIQAEQALKVDEARLQIMRQRVRTLEGEEARQNRLANKPASTSSGSGLFGSSGALGIFARTAAYGGAAAAIYTTIGAIRDGITYSLQFEDAMARLGAISGTTASQQQELAETIANVGKESRYSTLELVQAATTLAQAGFTQDEIAGSLKSISQLATASGTTIAEATDVVTSAIGAFDLQASETSHINDVLASALNRTKLNMQQVALGIQYAGATAHENKIPFEELIAVMATMANAGIRSGSTIGTGIRQFLIDLQTPTKKLAAELKKLHVSMADIDVDERGLPAVLESLAAAGFDSAAAYKTLETRAAAAYIVLRNNRDAINEQIIAQNQIGQSAEAAAKGQDSLAAEWQRFKNILNDGIDNGLKPAGDAIRDYLKVINDAAADDTIQKLQKQMDATSFWDPATQDKIEIQMAQYLDVRRDLNDAELAGADAVEKSSTAYNKASDAVGKQRTVLRSLDDATTRLNVRHKELSSNQLAMGAEVATLTNRFAGLAGYLNGTMIPTWDQLTNAVRAYRLEQLRALGTGLQSQMISARQQSGAFVGQANSTMAAGMREGLVGQLPASVRGLMNQVIKNPQDDNLRRQLFDSSAKLGGNLKAFVDQWSVEIDKGVNALRASNSARAQADVVAHLTTPKGVQLQSEVSAMAGQSDAAIKAKIAQYSNAARGKSPSVQQAYATLVGELESYIGSSAHPEAPESKKKSGGRGLPGRQDRALDALSLKADDAELKNAIKALLNAGGRASTNENGDIVVAHDRTLTPERLKQNVARVDGALSAWVDDRTQQVRDQIKQLKLDPSSGKGKEMMDDLQREIDAKSEDVHRQIGELVAKALDKVVKAIETTTKRAEEVADHQLQMVQARVSALDRQELDGRVPDYVRATVERQAGRAKDNRDRQQISINDAELANLTKARDDWALIVDYLSTIGDLENDDPAIKSLTALNDQIATLAHNNEELKATFGGEGLIPHSFNDNLQMAAANYREVNHLTASWSEMISMNLTDAFGTAQGAVTQFFSDIISGNATMAQSFGRMVKTVIGYLSQLIAKMIAVKLMEAAINILGGAAGGGKASVSSDLLNAAPISAGPGLGVPNIPSLRLYGGQIHALSGRYIRNGVPNRDSVDAKIARGEFVTRKWAVDNVGVDFMERLNNRGAAALKDFAPKVVMPPPSNQLMNVYVVAPDHQPTMGPNDVLVTIANDIYRGGSTKQLIKQVAQGG